MKTIATLFLALTLVLCLGCPASAASMASDFGAGDLGLYVDLMGIGFTYDINDRLEVTAGIPLMGTGYIASGSILWASTTISIIFFNVTIDDAWSQYTSAGTSLEIFTPIVKFGNGSVMYIGGGYLIGTITESGIPIKGSGPFGGVELHLKVTDRLRIYGQVSLSYMEWDDPDFVKPTIGFNAGLEYTF